MKFGMGVNAIGDHPNSYVLLPFLSVITTRRTYQLLRWERHYGRLI